MENEFTQLFILLVANILLILIFSYRKYYMGTDYEPIQCVNVFEALSYSVWKKCSHRNLLRLFSIIGLVKNVEKLKDLVRFSFSIGLNMFTFLSVFYCYLNILNVINGKHSVNSLFIKKNSVILFAVFVVCFFVCLFWFFLDSGFCSTSKL